MVLSLKFLELAHIVHAMPVLGTGWQILGVAELHVVVV